MFGRNKLKRQIVDLKYRIAELEERLCPCEQHDWVKTGFYLTGGTGMGDELTIYTHKCKRCGKVNESIYP